MANYYTQASIAVLMPKEHFYWIKAVHDAFVADYCNDDEDDADGGLPDDIRTVCADLIEAHGDDGSGIDTCEYNEAEGAAWISGDETVNVQYLADLLQAYLIRFVSALPVVVQWAETCNRPRADGFGGGAVIVSKDDQKWMSTSQWINDNLPSGPDGEPRQLNAGGVIDGMRNLLLIGTALAPLFGYAVSSVRATADYVPDPALCPNARRTGPGSQWICGDGPLLAPGRLPFRDEPRHFVRPAPTAQPLAERPAESVYGTWHMRIADMALQAGALAKRGQLGAAREALVRALAELDKVPPAQGW